MKPITIALLMASALFAASGAVFFIRTSSSAEEEAVDRSGGSESSSPALAANLAEVAGRLDRLEIALSRLERDVKRGAAAGAAAESHEADAAASEDETDGKKEKKSLASALAARDPELRSFVNQVIQEEREERAQEQVRRAEERQREFAEMQQGPYGQYNYRVNTLSKKLGLNDFQKQRYHALLSDYSTRIEDMRKNLDRNDQVAYRSYRERKQQFVEEFNGLVIQSLSVPQGQTYQGLPSSETSPAIEHAAMGGADNLKISLEGASLGEGAVKFFALGEDAGGGAVFTAPTRARLSVPLPGGAVPAPAASGFEIEAAPPAPPAATPAAGAAK